MSIFRCAQEIYRQNGLRGFYKGVTASYYGLAETVIHLVTYEEIKLQLREMRVGIGEDSATEIGYLQQFLEYMGAGAVSKTIATCVAYPHGRLLTQ